MGEKDTLMGLFGFCCCGPIIVICAICMGFSSLARQSMDDFSITTGDRFLIDWNTPLFSDIYARGKNETCDGVDEPVIHMPWFG